MTVSINLQWNGSLTAPARQGFLFADMEAAKAVFDQLTEATKAWVTRGNEREQFAKFEYLFGRASVDVSGLNMIEIEDPFGEHAETLRDWNRQMGELRLLAEPAKLGA